MQHRENQVRPRLHVTSLLISRPLSRALQLGQPAGHIVIGHRDSFEQVADILQTESPWRHSNNLSVVTITTSSHQSLDSRPRRCLWLAHRPRPSGSTPGGALR